MSGELDSLRGDLKISAVRGDTRVGKEQLVKNLLVEAAETNYLQRRSKNMEAKIQEVTEAVNAQVRLFGGAIDRLMAEEQRVIEHSKKATGNLRDCATKLADGMQKLEKTANFDRLERYVALLERAASAMSVLAELENSGKLDKIASALK